MDDGCGRPKHKQGDGPMRSQFTRNCRWVGTVAILLTPWVLFGCWRGGGIMPRDARDDDPPQPKVEVGLNTRVVSTREDDGKVPVFDPTVLGESAILLEA